MNKIQLPKTDLQVSQIAYGCMLIGGGWDRQPLSKQTIQDALGVLRAALDQGINFFDHADIYCLGKSEQVFSAVWKDSPRLRQEIILQSKCGIRFAGDPDPESPGRYDFSYKHIIRSVNGSLSRLKTDYLDLLLLHRPDPLVEPEEVARAFDELQSGGKVRYFGVSNHTAAQIELLQQHLNQPLVVNQVELNVIHSQLMDAGVIFNQDFPPVPGEGTLEYCRQREILIQAWAPMAGGAVTGKLIENPTQTMRNVAGLVRLMAKQKGVSPDAIVTAWLLRHPAGIQPVIGTTRVERIQAACQAITFELSREEWYRLFIAGRGATLP